MNHKTDADQSHHVKRWKDQNDVKILNLLNKHQELKNNKCNCLDQLIHCDYKCSNHLRYWNQQISFLNSEYQYYFNLLDHIINQLVLRKNNPDFICRTFGLSKSKLRQIVIQKNNDEGINIWHDYLKLWHHKNHNTKETRRKWYNERRIILMKEIAAGDPKCVRCGCNDFDLLEINHKSGKGYQIQKKYGYVYAQIKKQILHYSDLEILCRACNQIHFLEIKYNRKIPLRVVFTND